MQKQSPFLWSFIHLIFTIKCTCSIINIGLHLYIYQNIEFHFIGIICKSYFVKMADDNWYK